MAEDVKWLDDTHPIYDSHREEWEEEERRGEGGHGVLNELIPFDSEDATKFEARKKQATYINFPKAHASVITGQLRMHAPTPGSGFSFGNLGDIRSRDQIDEPTLAELAWYNVDGVGQDGSELPAWMDDVDVRAQFTGHRWLMVEAPREELAGRASVQQVRDGFRPFAVERSPLEAPNWGPRHGPGPLQWILFREPVDEPVLENGIFTTRAAGKDLGYYLLVRQGFTGLGATFQEGGWWRFDPEKKLLPATEGHRPWVNTLGQIPVWRHYGAKSRGTTNRRALSRSSTMELGQIAVSTMQAISARDANFWKACENKVLFLGATPDVMQEVSKQKDNLYIGVPLAPGVNGETQVAIHDASTGVVSAQVAESIIRAKFAEAREQSFQQITSALESSGISKEAGYAELKAPYLASRAALRQQSENILIYLWELRSGFAKPTGYSVWPREFNLAPLVDDIDKQFETMRRAGLRSPTLEAGMVFRAAQERNCIADPEQEETIQQELLASAEAARDRAAQTVDLFRQLDDGGGDEAPPSARRPPPPVPQEDAA